MRRKHISGRKTRHSQRPIAEKSRHARLHLQQLEDRRVLAALPTGFAETQVASGLSSPTAMEFSPTGQLWVLEQSGDVRIVQANGTTTEAIDLAVDSSGERGLLGIAFHPSYDGAGPNTDYVYLYYTDPAGPAPDQANNRLSRFTVTNAGSATPTINPATELVLRDLPPNTEDSDTNHNGGATHIGPDGKLYLAIGDHNYDGQTQAAHVSQRNDTPFGKILRLNLDGTNPGDNPFDNGQPLSWEGAIWAKGLRNPYTFSFSPIDGRMFINDVGEGQWEEINLGVAAGNYGWASSGPVWEGFENDGSPPPWTNYQDPAMAYDHNSSAPTPAGVAITGGAFYPANGQFGADYAGKYFFADYGAGFIRIFDPSNPGSVGTPDTSTGFATSASSPVDLKIGPDGNLYYLGRSGGVVFRVQFTGSYGPTTVAGEETFYNNSGFDGNDPAANAADDSAIADDKSAYLPGSGTATSDNVTSYARGINGIMIDLAGNHGPLSLSDLSFQMSPQGTAVTNTPGSWVAAPTPTDFVVRAGLAPGEPDRVEVVWADGAIVNRWLRVMVAGNDAAGGFNTNTGLASSYEFFYGNKVGDTFSNGGAGFFNTDATDQIEARFNQGNALSVSNVYDFDRDFLVNATDQLVARFDQGFLTAIDIDTPSAPEAADDGSGSAVASALAAHSIDAGAAVQLPSLRFDPAKWREMVGPPLTRLLESPIGKAITRVIAEIESGDLRGDLEDLLDQLLASRRR